MVRAEFTQEAFFLLAAEALALHKQAEAISRHLLAQLHLTNNHHQRVRQFDSDGHPSIALRTASPRPHPRLVRPSPWRHTSFSLSPPPIPPFQNRGTCHPATPTTIHHFIAKAPLLELISAHPVDCFQVSAQPSIKVSHAVQTQAVPAIGTLSSISVPHKQFYNTRAHNTEQHFTPLLNPIVITIPPLMPSP